MTTVLPTTAVPEPSTAEGGRSRATAPSAPTSRFGALLADVVADRESWWPLLHFAADRRWYHRYVSAPEHEIWLLTWLPGQRTGLHDHGTAAGAIAVVAGALTEHVIRPDLAVAAPPDLALAGGGPGRLTSLHLGAGSTRLFGPSHLHELVHTGAEPAVSVHVYSPRLSRMTRYAWTGSTTRVVSVEQAGVDW